MRALWVPCTVLAAAVGMAACGESTSGTKTAKKSDAKSWEGAGSTYAAPGWKPGDKASWDEQMRLRIQSQNDYARAK